MIQAVRRQYNADFTPEKYDSFLKDIHAVHPGAIQFRIAETPVFISLDFLTQMHQACEDVLKVLTGPDFKDKTKASIPRKLKVPGETPHPEFLVLDFGLCKNERGGYIPQLVELQGFPSMNAFQVLLANKYKQHFKVPSGFEPYLSGYDEQGYWQLLTEVILAGHDPEEVILLEVKPHEQKTKIDFYLTRDKLGVEPVCVTDLVKEGKSVFYYKGKKKIQVKRIYNRLIFDDLLSQKKSLGKHIDLTHHLDVEWAAHPNWFYRISKYALPLFDSPYVPLTYYLDKLEVIPADLENYVLKPLFSFAGQGVVLDVTKKHLDRVKDPQNWILQKKVEYAPVIETPDVSAKFEIRLMFYWKAGAPKPVLAFNLCRLSKGKMVGVRYNADKAWVGASIGLFEQPDSASGSSVVRK